MCDPFVPLKEKENALGIKIGFKKALKTNHTASVLVTEENASLGGTCRAGSASPHQASPARLPLGATARVCPGFHLLGSLTLQV